MSWSKCHIFLRSPLFRDHFGTFFGSLLSSIAELRQKIKMADFPFFPILETKNCSGAKLRWAEKKVSIPKILPRKCRICCQQKVWKNVNKQLTYNTKREKHLFDGISQMYRKYGMLCTSNESLFKMPTFKGLSSLGHPWDGAPGPQIGPINGNRSARSQRPLVVIHSKQKLLGSKSSVENCPRTWRLDDFWLIYEQNSESQSLKKSPEAVFRASEARGWLESMPNRFLAWFWAI